MNNRKVLWDLQIRDSFNGRDTSDALVQESFLMRSPHEKEVKRRDNLTSAFFFVKFIGVKYAKNDSFSCLCVTKRRVKGKGKVFPLHARCGPEGG